MTLVELDHPTHNGVILRTEECALCGARYGEDYDTFVYHLHSEHDATDVTPEADPSSDLGTAARRGRGKA